MENSSLGAKACRDLIFEQTGVWREVEAVKKHASRIGVSLKSFEICPECGVLVKRLNKTSGLCPICSERKNAASHKDYQVWLAAQIKATPEYKQAKRESDKERQRSARMARRNNLPSKVEFDNRSPD